MQLFHDSGRGPPNRMLLIGEFEGVTGHVVMFNIRRNCPQRFNKRSIKDCLNFAFSQPVFRQLSLNCQEGDDKVV